MTNLQKIQQETEEIFLEVFCKDGLLPVIVPGIHLYTEDLKQFIHSRESIAYEAGYEQGDREHFKSL